MIGVLTLFVILIFLLLVAFGVGGFLAWKKVELFLTWNTRYTAENYEQAVTATGKRPSLPAKKVDVRGRSVQQVPELVDITELEFEQAYSAVAEVGEQ